MATVTFLFTDIEGSTRMWSLHPDEMRAALAWHDETLTEIVVTRSGRVFKHTGDGIAAAFGSARDAVRAAIDIQESLARMEHPTIGRLRVRAGLHTGEADERDGDFFGIAVNRAARIMDAGHGGQILASAVTVGLAGDIPGCRELGAFRLADLTEPERIFQVVAPGVEGEHPPLRTLDRVAHNLPVFTSSFVGRGRERERLVEQIETSRLVTVTGVGGSGKTRLTLQVVAEMVGRFADGVWLVELASVNDPARVDDAVISALGVPRNDDRSARDALIDALEPKDLLLVVDNCEHLIEAAASLVEDILSHAKDVRVVATSRELLGVPGEVAYGLRSMSIPSDDDDLDAVRQTDAVQLFEQRASAAQSGFVVDETNRAAAIEICRRLDGMPLAIELAAARVRSFDAAQIAEHLDQRFRLLTGGSRTALPRQQTLMAAIDWSYRLLSEPERALFRRLSVFYGGFTFEAASVICSGHPVDELDLLELLPALVDKSLVHADSDVARTRYRLLETLRQFARDRLDDTGDGETWRRRHSEHFAALSDSATTESLNGPKGPETAGSLLADSDNILQATTWAVETGLGDLAAEAMYGLGRVFTFKGWWSEVIDRYEAILSLDLSPHRRAEALGALGAALVRSPRRRDSIEVLSQSAGIYRRLEQDGADPAHLTDFTRTLINFGYAHFVLGEAGEHNERFTEILEEALGAARRLSQPVNEAIALSNLAHHRDPQGDPTVARRRFDEAEAAAERSGSLDRRVFAEQRAFFEFDQGEWLVAKEYFEKDLALASERGSGERHQSAVWVAALELLCEGTGADNEFRDAIRHLYSDPERRAAALRLTTCLGFGICVDGSAERYERVAVARGVIDAVEEIAGALRWDVQRHVGEAVDRARAALGDERFEAAVGRGREMGTEQAIDFLVAVD